MLTGFDVSVPDESALVPRPNFNQGRRWRLSPPLRAYCALTVMPSIAGRSALGVRVRLNGEHFRNHPTARFAKRWLFSKCQRFRRSWSSTIESGGSSACNRLVDCKKEANAFAKHKKLCRRHEKGSPPKPNEVGLVGEGGATERLSFSATAGNEGCVVCDDATGLNRVNCITANS